MDSDSEYPDTFVLSLSGRTDRHRTDFFLKIETESGHRTKSRQKKSGQTDTGQKNSSESGQNPDTGQKRDRQNPDRQTPDNEFWQNPDTGQTPDRTFRKIRTKTGQGQDRDSAVRLTLVPTDAQKIVRVNIVQMEEQEGPVCIATFKLFYLPEVI